MSEAIRVLVVDDDPDVRESLEQLLRVAPTVELAGAFARATTAVEACRAGLVADVALVDLGLPDLPGHELIRSLRSLWSETAIVVLTVHEDRESLLRAFRAGATGYLLKDTPFEDLIAHLRVARAGGAPMSPTIARRIVDELRRPLAHNPLTSKESEVLELLTRGLSYAETGRALGIGVGTVQSHIKAIYRKLEVSSKAEATAEAYRRGLLR
ncbi:MAG: response regulator transcription factor [Polyangiaceae bacterium]|nr:response regulator transcription factor [Polyangiaceae bacterium]